MSGYEETLRREARLAILRFAEGAPKYTTNALMLVQMLHEVGIGYTRDQVVTELTWLAEQGLVTLEDHGPFLVATAQVRGVEIAQGIARHPEIARTRPGG
jgi:hypothetical protein